MKKLRTLIILLSALTLTATGIYAQQPQGPELPELMSLKPLERNDDETGKYLENTAWELIFKTVPQVQEFTAKLCERAKWDRKILIEMSNGTRPEDEVFAQKLIDESKNFVQFMINLYLIAENHTNVKMVKNSNGEWAYSMSPSPEFETNLWVNHVPRARPNERSTGYAVCYKNDQYQFCERPLGGGYTPVILDDDEMYIAKVAVNLMRNIGVIYESGALAILKEWYPNEYDHKRFEQAYQTCHLYLSIVTKAIEDNDKIPMEYQPMPKAGAMNASMKAKVLPLEKAITDKVVDCVVTSDGWQVETNAAGQPVRRVIFGYSIVQTSKGKQATKVSWAQEYQGDGTYGPVHAYGVGGGQFYVK